jgi:hypothetical protein
MVIHHHFEQIEVDDSSVTSTVTVGRSEKSLPLHPTSKSVSFNLEANRHHDPNLDKEDCSDLWYRAAEYKHFKFSTMCAARALSQSEAKNPAAFSFQRVMERTYDICLGLQEKESFGSVSTAQERRRLIRWAQVAPNRLGLEKWALRRIVKDKHQRRFDMIDFLLDFQDMKVNSCTTADHDSAEFIRTTCERISRPSRMFAVAIAQANAQACTQGNNALSDAV